MSNLEGLYRPEGKRKVSERFKITKSDPPESKELLASSIVKISEGFDALLASGVNREAIEILLSAKTKIARRDIRIVLDGLRKLKGWYCK